MKKIALLLFCLLLGVGVCEAGKRNRIENFVSTREVTLDNSYTGLDVSSMIQVILEADRNPEQIKIETEGISAEQVRVCVRGGVLELWCDSKTAGKGRKNDRNPRRITVYIGVGSLGSFVCSGASSVHSDAVIARPEVTIDAMGVSDVLSDVDCQTLLLELSGSSLYKGKVDCAGTASVNMMGVSDCAASGTTKDLALDISGSSDFHGRAFAVSGAANCFVTGASNASVYCTGELTFDVSGSSDFVYNGNPHILKASVGGSTVCNR